MPAVNPRITITLKPQVHAMLRRLSELTGNSQSAIVAELLESSQPVFERMAAVLDAAQRLKAEGMQATASIRKNLDDAQAKVEGQLGLALDAFDDFAMPLLDQAEQVTRRAGRAAGDARRRAPAARPAGAKKAPVSNRGVTPRENPEATAEKAVVRVTRARRVKA